MPFLGLMFLLSVYVQNIILGSGDKTAIIALLLDCIALLYMVIVKPMVHFCPLLPHFRSMHFLNSSVEAKETKENCTFCFFSCRSKILGELFN